MRQFSLAMPKHSTTPFSSLWHLSTCRHSAQFVSSAVHQPVHHHHTKCRVTLRFGGAMTSNRVKPLNNSKRFVYSIQVSTCCSTYRPRARAFTHIRKGLVPEQCWIREIRNNFPGNNKLFVEAYCHVQNAVILPLLTAIWLYECLIRLPRAHDHGVIHYS